MTTKVSLLRPFQRDGQRGFAKGDALAGRVGAVVASSGEVPWKPGLDGRVDRLRNQNLTAMRGAFAQVYVQEALGVWEPSLRDVSVTDTREAETLTLRVEWSGGSTVVAL